MNVLQVERLFVLGFEGGDVASEDGVASLLAVHDVMFLDFLGFAHAVQRWDDSRMDGLVRALVAIEKAHSSFDVRGQAQQDGSYRVALQAELTTFSDHVVVSYPASTKPSDMEEQNWRVLSSTWSDLIHQQMARIAAQLALEGLNIGLLVRGGVSRGKLYHHDRVVIGAAMVDAYRMESEVAFYPRIAVSSSVTDDNRIRVDADGTRCLDYLPELMLLTEDRYGDCRAWAEGSLVEIDKTIRTLRDSGNTKALQKWTYFRLTLATESAAWV